MGQKECRIYRPQGLLAELCWALCWGVIGSPGSPSESQSSSCRVGRWRNESHSTGFPGESAVTAAQGWPWGRLWDLHKAGEILHWRPWETLSPQPGPKGAELRAESSNGAAGASKEPSSSVTPMSEGKEDGYGVTASTTPRAVWLSSVEIGEEQRVVSL